MTLTVLITGASSGFGQAAVRPFAERGWNVVATMRDVASGACFEGFERVAVVALDVENRPSIDNAIEQGLAYFGRIDAVVNNAG